MKGLLVTCLLLAPPTLLDTRSGGHLTEGDGRNEVIMPEQAIEVPFQHALHLSEAGLECIDCHEFVGESKKAKDYNIPERALCLDCHDGAEIPWRWSPNPGAKNNAIAIPPARIHFPHDRHLALDGVDCATCHPNVAEGKLATRDDLPSMETCLSCHDGERASDDCRTCHLKGAGGTIRTAFAKGQLIPDDHGLNWLDQHEVAAERDLAQCASCHAQEDCISCHDGAVPPGFHDGNYLLRHPQEAFANSPNCATCHRLDRFCRDCHFRAGVTSGDRLPAFGTSFHPEGWAFDPASSKHHSRIARKNIQSCYACHDGESCVGCHTWFDGAPRTHGPGWAGSSRMRRLKQENLALCMRCHDLSNPSDPINVP
jgi:c(7)-type cytochrome triheme protein